MISRIHLSLPNAYKPKCFDRKINGNRNVKFFEWDYWSLHRRKNLTLVERVKKSDKNSCMSTDFLADTSNIRTEK